MTAVSPSEGIQSCEFHPLHKRLKIYTWDKIDVIWVRQIKRMGDSLPEKIFHSENTLLTGSGEKYLLALRI